MPANLVFRRKIWGARDNGIPSRSTPVVMIFISLCLIVFVDYSTFRILLRSYSKNSVMLLNS